MFLRYTNYLREGTKGANLNYYFVQILRNTSYLSSSDNNECTLLTHNCDNNAKCLNTNGSFTCSCNPGYSGNGVKCEGMEINDLPQHII